MYSLVNTLVMMLMTILPYALVLELGVLLLCACILLFLSAFVVLRFREPVHNIRGSLPLRVNSLCKSLLLILK